MDVWLYGPLARYGNSDSNVFAQLDVTLPEGSTLQDLLDSLQLPTEERGITFINGNLSAMPGLQPDLAHPLMDKDRVALFHQKSMWPFQYRHDVASIPEFKASLRDREDKGLQSRYDTGTD